VDKFKFVIIGFGHIGKRHATVVNQHPETEVIAIIDTNSEVVNDKLFPIGTSFFNSIDSFLLKKLEVDVVVIATPNGFHCTYSIMALGAGYNVLIEKPMGLTTAECEEVISKSIQMSKQVFVVKQNRYSPPIKWMKEIVGLGTIGEVLTVQINCYWNRDSRYYQKGGWRGTLKFDGGTLFTQFSHFIDILFWVFGDIKNIKATFANLNHFNAIEFEDCGLVNFVFVNGGIGCINFSTSVWDKNLESSIVVIGSKGSFKIGGQYMDKVEYCHIENYTMPELPPTNAPNDYGPFKGSAANHHYVIENVVNTLAGRDTITANALEGLKVVDIIERIYEHRDLITLKKKS
jgi:UDP-N-acetyl-2-amino-2-deoxyglucuronate dehydrogenase